MLGLEVEVVAGDARVHDALRAVAHDAAHDAPPTAWVRFAIAREEGLLTIAEEGGDAPPAGEGRGRDAESRAEGPIVEVSAAAAAEHVGKRARARAIALADPAALLTATVGTRRGCRFALLAEDLRAHAHLAATLHAHGVAIEGAHLAALHDDGRLAPLAEPIRLVGDDPPPAVRDVAPLRRPGHVLRPLHPSPWHVRDAAVDALVDARLGTSADVRATPIARWDAARAAHRHTLPRDPARTARALAALASRVATAARVDAPTPAEALDALDRALQ